MVPGSRPARKQRSQSHFHKEWNSANNLEDLECGFSPQSLQTGARPGRRLDLLLVRLYTESMAKPTWTPNLETLRKQIGVDLSG